MKFDKKYPNAQPGQVIGDSHDMLFVSDHDEACAECGEPTRFIDYCFECRICSDECSGKADEEWLKGGGPCQAEDIMSPDELQEPDHGLVFNLVTARMVAIDTSKLNDDDRRRVNSVFGILDDLSFNINGAHRRAMSELHASYQDDPITTAQHDENVRVKIDAALILAGFNISEGLTPEDIANDWLSRHLGGIDGIPPSDTDSQ